MLYRQFREPLYRVRQRSRSLPGNAEHHICGNIVETRFMRGSYQPLSLRRVVQPAELPQFVVLQRLHPDGNAVHARIPQQFQRFRGGGSGIAFRRYLRAGRDGHRAKYFSHMRGYQVRRTATEIHGVEPLMVIPQVPHNCRSVISPQRFFPGHGVKVAVRALAQAERNVDIKSPQITHRQA